MSDGLSLVSLLFTKPARVGRVRIAADRFAFQEQVVARYKAQSALLPFGSGDFNRSVALDKAATGEHRVSDRDPSAVGVIGGAELVDTNGPKVAHGHDRASPTAATADLAIDREEPSTGCSHGTTVDRAEDDHSGDHGDDHDEEVLNMSDGESSSSSSLGAELATVPLPSVSTVAVGAHLRRVLPHSTDRLLAADAAEKEPLPGHRTIHGVHGKPTKRRRSRQHDRKSKHTAALLPASVPYSGANSAMDSACTPEPPKQRVEAPLVRSLSATLMSSPPVPSSTIVTLVSKSGQLDLAYRGSHLVLICSYVGPIVRHVACIAAFGRAKLVHIARRQQHGARSALEARQAGASQGARWRKEECQAEGEGVSCCARLEAASASGAARSSAVQVLFKRVRTFGRPAAPWPAGESSQAP